MLQAVINIQLEKFIFFNKNLINLAYQTNFICNWIEFLLNRKVHP